MEKYSLSKVVNLAFLTHCPFHGPDILLESVDRPHRSAVVFIDAFELFDARYKSIYTLLAIEYGIIQRCLISNILDSLQGTLQAREFSNELSVRWFTAFRLL
jgi:hypothetical protein